MDTFTEADESSAIAKITKVAFTYDNTKPALQEFAVCGFLTAGQFRELMRRNFQINLTPEEVAALMHLFNENDNKLINTRLFVYHFFRMGRSERDHFRQMHMKVTADKQKKQKERIEAIKDKFGKLILAKTAPPTDVDRASAEKKIRLAAAYFNRDKAFPVDIEKCFESRDLTPTDFRAILKNNFYIDLTPGELEAVMAMFDTDGDGSISCVEFLTTFFIIECHRQESERRAFEQSERIRLKVEAQEALNITKVIWPILPVETPLATTPMPLSGRLTPNNLPPIDGTCSPVFPKSRLRKPSVIDMIAPNKIATMLMKTNKSLTRLYPKASQETKDFILQIEEEEQKISNLTVLKKKKKKSTNDNNGMNSNSSAGSTNSAGNNSRFNSPNSKFAPRMQVHEEDDAEEERDSHNLDDPNNWGSSSLFPNDNSYFEEGPPARLPPVAIPADRCDSRGGSRSGVSRIPIVSTKQTTDDSDEYDDSEFEDKRNLFNKKYDDEY